MERLTVKLVDGCFMPKRMIYDNKSYCEEYCIGPCDDDCPINACFQKLADYEDAEEQGRLIEFPVAIGDHVWCFPSETEPYREMQVIGLSCDFGARYVQVQDVITCEDVYFNAENLDTSMFTTKEQAEAKLKELEKRDGKE